MHYNKLSEILRAKNTKKEKACKKGSIEKYAKSLILQAFSGQHDRQKKNYFLKNGFVKKKNHQLQKNNEL